MARFYKSKAFSTSVSLIKTNLMETTLSVICLLVVAVFVPCTSAAAAADAAPSPVLDISRAKLLAEAEYYILPVFRGRGGGLTLGSARNKTCPLDVVQDRFEVSNGLPLMFSPVNAKKGSVIRVSTDPTDLNVKFSASTICAQSTVWKLDSYDELVKQWFVTSGGVEGNPGPGTTSNWFKIDKFGDDYKLVFCPTVCNFCKVLCRDIGVFIDEKGNRRLALSDNPFRVMFKKA